MARPRISSKCADADTGAKLKFEAKLWRTADALRSNMGLAEYKNVVLDLIFLKYISAAFDAKHVAIESHRKRERHCVALAGDAKFTNCSETRE